jgi:exopolysaccharide biosynthesis polyprenyl glycosylphosphotransferase
MLRRFSIDFTLFSISLDAILIAVSLAIATYIRPVFNRLPFVVDIPEPIPTPWPLYIAFPVMWVLVLSLVSIYDSRRYLKLVNEITNLTFGSILAGITLAGMLFLSYRGVSRFLFIIFVVLSYLSIITWRLVFRVASQRGYIRSAPVRKVLIIGAGVIGRELQTQIQSHRGIGLSVVGFLDDDSEKRENNEDIFGALNRAHNIVLENEIDDVVLALPSRAYERVNELVADLHDLPVKVWVIPDYFSLALHRAKVDEFAGLPMLDLRAPAISDIQRLIKRVFDIVIAAISIAITFPIMVLTAIAIRLDSPGPILLRQKRAGENGKIFEMLKFRTMIANADQLEVEWEDEFGNFIHKHTDDPRVTSVGHVLRRLSLDELPQLSNVLKGEMSLVGPRPELPFLVEQYEPWQRKRFAVPQGMTGWWQINGRSDKPMHLNTEDDLYYVQNYSLLFDIEIMLKTVWVVVRGKGAY